MHNKKIVFVISTLILLTLACNALTSLPDSNNESPQTLEPSSNSELPLTEAEVQRVTVKDAKAALDNGTAILVDVRSRASYETSHAAEALFVPLNEIESNIANIDLPKKQWIITYCT
ncbi:MAG TPA: rhodanese-like domain-containing protein [Anaerolineales bacterium]